MIPYSDLPGFPVSSVEGHAGQLVCGSLGDLPVACYQGRVHMYEGGNPQDLRTPTYALKLIGCDALVVTSAVGSLHEDVGPGALVCVSDHINMQPASPLVGANDEIGPRFTSMVDAYDPTLRAALHAAAQRTEVQLHDGVFLATMGPMFETPAEIRAYRTLGADVVGMSCVVEVTVAKHCGLRAAAVTVVVNLAAGMTGDALDHEETLHFSSRAAGDVALVLREFAASAPWGLTDTE